MRVLVTGAAGFIGRHVCKALTRQGVDVIALDINFGDGFAESVMHDNIFPSNLTPVRQDITDVDGMRQLAKRLGGVDACIHLAAIASPPIVLRDQKHGWAVNVQGTYNVLNLLREVGCKKIVFFSSAHIYGISPKYLPTDENHPLALHDPYTVTKIMGERLCDLFYANHLIEHTTLRLFNCYGPGQSPEYFLGKKISQAKAGHVTLRSGNTTKDWVYISDVVQATLAALRTHFVGPINIGTGVETDLATIANMVAKAFNVPLEREDGAVNEDSRMCCDWGRAKAILGWSPATSFEDGLSSLVAFEQAPRPDGLKP